MKKQMKFEQIIWAGQHSSFWFEIKYGKERGLITGKLGELRNQHGHPLEGKYSVNFAPFGKTGLLKDRAIIVHDDTEVLVDTSRSPLDYKGEQS